MQKTKIKNNNTKKKTYVHIWILNTTTTTSSGAKTTTTSSGATKTTTATVAVVAAAITTTQRRTPRTHQILYIPHCCILFTYIRMPNKNSARVPIYILCAVRTGNGTQPFWREKKRDRALFLATQKSGSKRALLSIVDYKCVQNAIIIMNHVNHIRVTYKRRLLTQKYRRLNGKCFASALFETSNWITQIMFTSWLTKNHIFYWHHCVCVLFFFLIQHINIFRMIILKLHIQ